MVCHVGEHWRIAGVGFGDGCDRSLEEIPIAAELVRENALVGGVIRTLRRDSGTESVAATPPDDGSRISEPLEMLAR